MRILFPLITIIFLFSSFILAQDEPPPPPPPHVMIIYMKGGYCDSILCSNIDNEVGITFNKFEMKVPISELVPESYPPTYIKSVRTYCSGIIDSITFPLYVPPSTQPPAE